MKLKKKSSIKFKFLTGLLLIFLFLLILNGFYFIMLYKNLLKYEQEKINIYNKSVSININKDIRGLIDNISGISYLSVFQEVNVEGIKEFIYSLENRSDLVSNAFFCDKNGNIIINSSKESDDLDLIGDNCADYSFFKHAVTEKNVFISDNYSENNLFTTISTPILKNDEVIGVIVGLLKLNDRGIEIFNNIIDPESYEWQILLTNQRGILLYHTHKKIENLGLNDLDYSLYPSVNNALLGNWELSTIKIDNKTWLTSSEFISLCGWYVIVQVPRELIINKIISIVAPSLLLVIILIIILSMLLFIWANMIVNPLVRLTMAIREYGEKGTSRVLKRHGSDEISVAIRTFNNMMIERKDIEREVLQIIEKERKSIGREVHDDLEEKLRSIYHQILIVREELNKYLKDENLYIISYLEKIIRILNEAINRSKTLSGGLCPVSLYDGGIIKAVEELIAGLKSTYDFRYKFDYDEDIIIQDELISLNIYYIFREAILNAVRNKRADNLDILFKINNEDLVLKIFENGIMVVEYTDEIKMSIKVMNYIARLINADLRIDAANGGTEVSCIIKEYN